MEECFYLLTIIFNPYYELINQVVTSQGCCVCFFGDRAIGPPPDYLPVTVRIAFFTDKIQYKFYNSIHVQNIKNTVEYIYYIMRALNVQWMNRVLDCVQGTLSLSLLCKLKIRFGDKESILRRFLTPARTVLQDMCFKGRMLSGDEYAQYCKKVIMSKYTLFGGMQCTGVKDGIHCKVCSNRETIYMHDYFCFGIYSKRVNFYTLTHLLAAEAVLFEKHHWEEIIDDCYYCQIEKFDLIIWRNQWTENVDLFIFMDDQLATLFKDNTFWSPQKFTLLDDIDEICPAFSRFRMRLSRYLGACLFQRRFPLRVKSLRQLAELQLTMNVFIKRMELFQDQVTHIGILTASLENNANYKASLRNLLMDTGKLFEQCKNPMSCFIKGEQYTQFNASKVEASFQRIKTKATIVPFQAHHTVAKITDSFRQFGPDVTLKYEALSPDV